MYTKDDIDFFYTYFQDQGYLVSIEEANGKTFRWRYEYPSNGQKIGIHIADEYKIEEVLKTL
jgi:YD repeat-containing protein